MQIYLFQIEILKQYDYNLESNKKMNTLTINVDVFKNFLVQAGQTLFRAKKHSNVLHTLAGRRQGDTTDESGDQDGNLHCGSKSSCERKNYFVVCIRLTLQTLEQCAEWAFGVRFYAIHFHG